MYRVCLLLFLLSLVAFAGPLPGPVPDALTIIYDGLRWAWASPCDGGCSMPLPTYQVGWDYATTEEWADRPTAWDFLAVPGDTGTVRCASPYFDPIYSHCDWSNGVDGDVTSHPTGSYLESWFVQREGGVVPEPSTFLLASGGLAVLLRRRLRR